MASKKIVVFDLDGTLAESRSSLDSEMAILFCELLSRKKVAIISGGGFPQFEKQVLNLLSHKNCNFDNLYIFPTKGGSMFQHKNGEWEKIYEEKLSDEEKKKIKDAFEKVLKVAYFIPTESYGEKLEDRDSQFTFSALGHDAPFDLKQKWDPDASKRMMLKKALDQYLGDFDVGIGGSTSIDVTKKNIDKAYAINKIMEYLNIKKEEIVFVGDSLFPGGNDYPVIKTGVLTIPVKSVSETKNIVRSFLS